MYRYIQTATVCVRLIAVEFVLIEIDASDVNPRTLPFHHAPFLVQAGGVVD